ncbi:MAG: hypothetical protein P8H25_02055 [Flavobacteriaceae bacterium]|nr:hypothetical protein [Flavobacteriaceae bacterium]
MIQKIFLLLAFTLFTTIVSSQNDATEKANKLTNEMTQALSLDEEVKTKIFEIQLNRFQEAETIREQYMDDSETKKAELKKMYNRLYGKLKATLGEEKMKAWNVYKQNN